MISEAEILAEIQAWNKPPERDPGTLTGPEIAEVMGLSVKTAYPRIRSMVAAGKLEPIRFPIVNVCGTRTSTWGYRVVTQPAR